MPRDDNPLKHAPHTAEAIAASEWKHPYSREQAAFPAAWTRARKFWPSVGRINNAHGDRNLVCTCPPIEAYSIRAESTALLRVVRGHVPRCDIRRSARGGSSAARRRRPGGGRDPVDGPATERIPPMPRPPAGSWSTRTGPAPVLRRALRAPPMGESSTATRLRRGR